MHTIKVTLAALVTVGLTFALDTSLPFGETTVPPLGKFLSPFQGFWQNAENERLDVSDELEIPGLQEPVRVYFDDMLIPHIYANNDHDLFLAQGYITAFHRLWQMEFQLYGTAGRISEILGDKALEYDRQKRRSGMTMGARASEELVKKEEPYHFAMIEAYAKGVNAYISSLDYEDFPIEYKLLDYAPEEWTTFKTFLLLREMADQLSRDERDLEHTNALKIWGPEIFNKLYPERYDGIDPIIPRGTKWDFDPITPNPPTDDNPSIATIGEVSRPNPQFGSNNFVVNGQKTASGNVLLANEPDLALNLPSIWYIAHLNSPNYNVMGSTVPGGPGVILGFNDFISWGFTNAKRDVADWYKIDFKDDSREEYKYDNKWLKTKKIVEEIEIKNGSTFYDTIVHTHYGPICYDENFNGNQEKINLALKWTAHDASKEVKAFLMANKAENYEEYVEAFAHYAVPAQNMIYGDVHGNIALWVNGKFPVKWEGQGKYILDGGNSSHEWKTFMPREHMLFVKNPDQNFISSANQHPADSTYPYYSYDYNYEHYRNRRINDRLRVLDDIIPQDMMKLQNDNYNYMASESLPMMLSSLDTVAMKPSQREYYDQLADWDYFNEPELTEPSIYQLWFDLFCDKTWDEFENQIVSLYRPHDKITVQLMNSDSAFTFFDHKSTNEIESVQDIAQLTFFDALDSMERWKKANEGDYSWYLYKNTSVRHILRLPAFSRDHVKIGGNNGIVNAASKSAGPSWRFVVELGDKGVKAWGIYPGSQSGNPGNPSYGEFIDRWAAGKYEPMLFESDVSNSERIQALQTLNPVK